MAPQILAIAGNTVRELVRSKLLYNLLLFAVLLIGGSLFVAQLTVGDFGRVMVDMGLVAIEVVGTLIAVLIGVSVVAGEIEKRTIFATLAKPLSRTTFLLGRYAGVLVILAVNVAVMLASLAVVLKLAAFDLTRITALAALLIGFELALVAAIALFFSTFTTPVLASAFSFSLFLIGHLLSDVRNYGTRSKRALAKQATAFVYRVLPDLELFNLKAQAANNLPEPPGFVRWSILYGVLYTAVLLSLAVILFRKRDLK